MRDTQLYQWILGIDRPWKVTDVELDLPGDEVRVRVEHACGSGRGHFCDVAGDWEDCCN